MSSSYKSQIEQVIEYLKVEKTRKAALDILLSVSESKDLVDIFLELEIPKLMIRLVENEDIKEKETVLQLLINLSANEKYLNSFLTINTFHRILKTSLFYNIKKALTHRKHFLQFNKFMQSPLI